MPSHPPQLPPGLSKRPSWLLQRGLCYPLFSPTPRSHPILLSNEHLQNIHIPLTPPPNTIPFFPPVNGYPSACRGRDDRSAPEDLITPRAGSDTGALRTAKHVQSESLCKEAETWVFVEAEDEEREDDVAEEEGEVEKYAEPLKERKGWGGRGRGRERCMRYRNIKPCGLKKEQGEMVEKGRNGEL